MEQVKILLVEDNPGDARLIRDMLAENKSVFFDIDWKQTLAGSLESLKQNSYHAVLLDLGLPDSPQSSATFPRVHEAAPALPVIILTGLDDETFAVTTVRRGAQDYLVKGTFDAVMLVRRIRYAIARKMGGEKLFTATELQQFDGKGGRAAYFAFQGKVYDATNSHLWKEGTHGAKHAAGNDLTGFIVSAPHGEETIERLPIVGYLKEKETLHAQLLRKFDSFHPHITFNHLTIASSQVTSVAFLIWLFSGSAVFEQVAWYLLILVLFVVTLSFMTGILSWMVNYESKANRVFNNKLAFGIMLFALALGTFVWRLTGQETITAGPGKYLYLASLLAQSCLASALDHFGKKIMYS